MKKVFLVMMLLLIPLASATIEEHILEAKQANLDARASRHIAQMDAIIEFGDKEDVDVSSLKDLRDTFKNTLSEALGTTTKESFTDKYKALKDISNDFKDETKAIMNASLGELKNYVDDKMNSYSADEKY